MASTGTSSSIGKGESVTGTGGTDKSVGDLATGPPGGKVDDTLPVENVAKWIPSKQLWSKGKLKTHFEKHGSEFGAKSSKEYTEKAFEFGRRENVGDLIETTSGAFIYRFEPSTNTVFVGTQKGGKIKSFYKWDGRSDDVVINTLKRKGKL